MTSSRPYLIRAMYEWMLDNGMTPHLVVMADFPGTIVPRQYVKDGKIVLNVAPMAVRDLQIGNEAITFSARFGGQSMNIMVPVAGAIAIYTRENGKGMVFTPEEQVPPPPPTIVPLEGGQKPAAKPSPKSKSRPALKVVK
ncbi:MAG: ClpXP protease specificity-enhancing factor [Thiotrichales bacterium]